MTESSSTQYDHEALRIREFVNHSTTAASDLIQWPTGMEEHQLWTESLDGTQLEVRRFIPKVVVDQPGDASPNRAVVFAFGGAFVGGSIDIFRGFISIFGELSGTQVFAPQWRTAPEHPYPAGVEDVYATVQFIQKNASRFYIDPARIVIAGLSAGGTLAAAVSILARDRNLKPAIAAQVLRYPALDDTTVLKPHPARKEPGWWTQRDNDTIWKAYMGGIDRNERDDRNTPPYAAPARSKDLQHLPPAHIAVGEYDLLCNEDRLYAQRLRESGVEVEYFEYPQSSHGFDGIPGSVQARLMWDREAAFVKKF